MRLVVAVSGFVACAQDAEPLPRIASLQACPSIVKDPGPGSRRRKCNVDCKRINIFCTIHRKVTGIMIFGLKQLSLPTANRQTCAGPLEQEEVCILISCNLNCVATI